MDGIVRTRQAGDRDSRETVRETRRAPARSWRGPPVTVPRTRGHPETRRSGCPRQSRRRDRRRLRPSGASTPASAWKGRNRATDSLPGCRDASPACRVRTSPRSRNEDGEGARVRRLGATVFDDVVEDIDGDRVLVDPVGLAVPVVEHVEAILARTAIERVDDALEADALPSGRPGVSAHVLA